MIPSILAVALLASHHRAPLIVSLGPGVNSAVPRRSDPVWKRANQEVSANAEELSARLSFLRKSDLAKHIIYNGKTTAPTITLTFDDGPHPACTQKLVKVLKDLHVPATFFVVGFMAEKYPELLRAIKAGGFEIGNHTYSHATLTLLSQQDTFVEFRATNDVIKQVTGTTPRFCRPPGGDLSMSVLRSATDLGLSTVMWTDDPGDYENLSDSKLLKNAIGRLSPGGIILMHDCPRAVETVPMIVSTARAMGYRFVPLSDYIPR